MSEREKNILTQLARTIPKLDEKKQNYILGVAEGMAMVREDANKEAVTAGETK